MCAVSRCWEWCRFTHGPTGNYVDLRGRDVWLSLLDLFYHSLLTHGHNGCWADWPAQDGSNRKAGRGKSMKPKLLPLYNIHATYRGK